MRGWAVGLGAAVVLLSLPAAAFAIDPEQAVKAAYLARFAPFVSWPAGTLPSEGQPLALCVQADEAFTALVARAAAGAQVAGHPVAVRRIAVLDAAENCQIAFLGGVEEQSAADALQVARRRPILTVTDEANGPGAGVVHLIRVNGQQRFRIDVAMAQESRLVISSKLLALAVAVKR